jgi:hypothetical protein
MLSKAARMSNSSTQSYRQHRSRVIPTAASADLPGLYPYESGWNSGSNTGSRASLTTIWARRSDTVGTPKRLCPPLFLGISTTFTGGGK